MLQMDIRHPMLTTEGKVWLEVSACVEPGELLCLFGPSGSGKTTLLRILAGLLRPESGRISFGDQVWFDSAAHIDLPPQRRNVGFMFQDYALFPNLTVEKQLRFAQRTKNPEVVRNLMEHFGLTQLAGRKPHQLSGGQKQRLALARALASDPRLLMLDEPLSALDQEMRLSLQEEIRKAHRLLGSVSLLVSHDVEEVIRLATSVLVLDNGRMVTRGEPSEILHFARQGVQKCRLSGT